MRPTVRDARPSDASALAAVHVRSWQETYRGLMPDDVLDAADAVPRREGMWSRILTDDSAEWRAAVAVVDGEIVGFALTGDATDPGDPQGRILAAIYLLAAHHGSGAGPGLLDAVLDDDRPTCVWVAVENPRARAFYLRSGFAPDGAEKDDAGMSVMRMLRPARRVPGSAT